MYCLHHLSAVIPFSVSAVSSCELYLYSKPKNCGLTVFNTNIALLSSLSHSWESRNGSVQKHHWRIGGQVVFYPTEFIYYSMGKKIHSDHQSSRGRTLPTSSSYLSFLKIFESGIGLEESIGIDCSHTQISFH